MIRTLTTGHGLLESPRWHDGRLWFADWIAGEIRVLDEDGASTVAISHPSLPLCFDFLPDGTPLVVSGPERAVLRADGDGAPTRYADLSHLSAYDSNDIVVDGRGNTYVDNGNGIESFPAEGSTAPGLVFLVRPDGSAEVVADDLAFPNGMAVSADNSTLVVAESYRHRLTAFTIHDDGTLGDRRVFADLGVGTPDGICFDASGAIWFADVPNAWCRRVREGGEVLQTVELDRGGFACITGGADGRQLYVVGADWPGMAALQTHTEWRGTVWVQDIDVPGAGWPGN